VQRRHASALAKGSHPPNDSHSVRAEDQLQGRAQASTATRPSSMLASNASCAKREEFGWRAPRATAGRDRTLDRHGRRNRRPAPRLPSNRCPGCLGRPTHAPPVSQRAPRSQRPNRIPHDAAEGRDQRWSPRSAKKRWAGRSPADVGHRDGRAPTPHGRRPFRAGRSLGPRSAPPVRHLGQGPGVELPPRVIVRRLPHTGRSDPEAARGAHGSSSAPRACRIAAPSSSGRSLAAASAS